jgi:hypothetical protein
LKQALKDNFSLCSNYYYLLGGAAYISIPAGMSVGITNNIGAVIVLKLIPLIRLHSRTKQQSLEMLLIHFMATINFLVFLPITGNFYNWSALTVPEGMSK